MKLSPTSERRLQGVHPDLVKVVRQAEQDSPMDFMVTEGLRTAARQAELAASGASQTLRSRHLPHPQDGLSRAVDLAVMVGSEVRWDWPLYHKLAAFMKAAAKKVGVPIECGADWKKFPDGPHFQLPWKEYP